jgi:hypothetical protein
MKKLTFVAIILISVVFVAFIGKQLGKTEPVRIMLGVMDYTCKYQYWLPDGMSQERNIETTNGELNTLKAGDLLDGIKVLKIEDSYTLMAKNNYSTFNVYCKKGGIWGVQ